MEERVDRAAKVFVAAAMACAWAPWLVTALISRVVNIPDRDAFGARISQFAFWLLIIALMGEVALYRHRDRIEGRNR